MAEPSDKDPARRNPWPRRIFLVLGGLFWLAALAAGLELFATGRDRADERLARKVEAEMYGPEAAAPDQEVIKEYSPKPPEAGKDFEARQAFFGLDDTQRVANAAARGEIAVLCRSDGTVERVWPPPEGKAAPEILAFARALVPEKPFAEALPPDAKADAREAFTEALSGGRPLREYPFPQPGDAPPYVMQFAWQAAPDNQSVAVFVRDSMWKTLWQALRPGVSQFDAMDLRINSLGFRDDEVAIPKPAGTYRIVCVGGSTTAEGLSNALTYPNIVEAKFARALGPGRVDVVNAGIFAISSYVEVEHIPDYLALEPDLVVYYNFVNDVPSILGRWQDVPSEWNRMRTQLLRSRFVYDWLNPLLLPNDAVIDRAIDETILANMGRLADACREKGCGMAVCTFAAPDYGALDRGQRAYFDLRINNMLWGRLLNMSSYLHVLGRFNARVREFCAERGLQVIPVAESLKGGTDCFTDICHLRPRGIERKAQVVFETLQGTLEKGLESKK